RHRHDDRECGDALPAAAACRASWHTRLALFHCSHRFPPVWSFAARRFSSWADIRATRSCSLRRRGKDKTLGQRTWHDGCPGPLAFRATMCNDIPNLETMSTARGEEA